MENNAEMYAFSSLEKIRNKDEMPPRQLVKLTALRGEHLNFQVFTITEERGNLPVRVDSKLSQYITLYTVHNAVMDYIWFEDEDIITNKPGLMPDILVPVCEQNGYHAGSKYGNSLWVSIKLPKDALPGIYDVTVNFGQDCAGIELEIIDEEIPDNKLKYTQWFHPDCIASYYGVDMYSPRHWQLLQSYMKTACDIGINMILTPVLSLSLDTIVGGAKRPDCSLVDIALENGIYSFGYSRLDKYIDMALECGMEYFEISHLFHPGGAEWCCNVSALVEGEKKYIFDSSMRGDNPGYTEFLIQFVSSLVGFLKTKGIFGKCFFHISDEPNDKNIAFYEKANSIVRPLFEGRPLMDALSNVEYSKRGLVDIAVADMEFVENFIDTDMQEKWCYYCCGDWNKCSNRFLNMPQYRNRILGLQLYKFGFDGFLHWGYNFYYCSGSMYDTNPYMSTSAGMMFPSGDAFSVYPAKNGPHLSMRALVFKEAIDDICICRCLEKYIGRENVIKLIDSEAGMKITFFEYPRNAEFVPLLVEKMKSLIKENIKNGRK